MPTLVNVRRLPGKQLSIRIRGHSLVTDRPLEQGGSDRGCSSGELLLAAIGSCCAGSLRNFLERQCVSDPQFGVTVFFEPTPVAGARDRIVIEIDGDVGLDGFPDAAIIQAATFGGVTSRVRLGSEVEVRIRKRQ